MTFLQNLKYAFNMAISINGRKMPHLHKFLDPNRSSKYKVHAQGNFFIKKVNVISMPSSSALKWTKRLQRNVT
jgi:hypothetical protein